MILLAFLSLPSFPGRGDAGGRAGQASPKVESGGACLLERCCLGLWQGAPCLWDQPMLGVHAASEQRLLLTGFFPLLLAASGSDLTQWVPSDSGTAGAWGRKRDEAHRGCLPSCTPSVKFQDAQKNIDTN